LVDAQSFSRLLGLFYKSSSVSIFTEDAIFTIVYFKHRDCFWQAV